MNYYTHPLKRCCEQRFERAKQTISKSDLNKTLNAIAIKTSAPEIENHALRSHYNV